MNPKNLIPLLLPVLLLAALPAFSQVTVSGSIQSDILIPEDDEKIGTEHSKDKVLTNTYVDLNLGSKYVDAGARFEFLKYPLLLPSDFSKPRTVIPFAVINSLSLLFISLSIIHCNFINYNLLFRLSWRYSGS